MRKLVLLVCVAALAVACSDDSEPNRRAAPSLTPSSAPEPACPNQEAVVDDASLRTGNPARGDVDGDGFDDDVSIYFDAEGRPGCQAFVAASSEDRTIAGALETWRSEFGLPMPTLNALKQVDGEPGLEVVVNMGVGASTQFVGVVKAEGGALKQVTVRGPRPDGPGAGMFGFGGSVGHLEAVDCVSGGGVVTSFATPDGDLYSVKRTLFGFDGAELARMKTETVRVPFRQIDGLPGFAASPFESCS